jgi:hypothetical protein
MILHVCPRCSYKTNHKTNIINHFKRKIICENLNSDTSLEECIRMLNEYKLTKVTNKQKTKIEHTCIHCLKKFDRKLRLESHEEKCEIKNIEIEKLKNELQRIKNTSIVPKSETEHHIYIIHEREFVNTGQPIYKIGKTTKSIKRLSQYPKDSKLKLLLAVENCHESEKLLIVKFDEMFVNKAEIGREYYEGELKEMIKLYLDFI